VLSPSHGSILDRCRGGEVTGKTVAGTLRDHVLASMWWLERRYPNQFALRNVHRTEGSTDSPVGDKVDEDQLRRYAALMDDFRRENEAKKPAQTPALSSPEVAAG
jgi:hypothetical protein